MDCGLSEVMSKHPRRRLNSTRAEATGPSYPDRSGWLVLLWLAQIKCESLGFAALALAGNDGVAVMADCGSYARRKWVSHLRIKTHRFDIMHRPLQSLLIVCILTSAMFLPAGAQQLPPRNQKLKAPTPPMGWNNWDAYGETINEAQVRANAEWMAQHLKQFGWQYVVIDEGWYVSNPGAKPEDIKFSLDDNGRFIPVLDRFPSAVNGAGFKPLADYVHSLGLKFGIHILRGIPREAVTRNLRVALSPYTASEAAVTDDTCPWNTFMYGVQEIGTRPRVVTA